MVGNYCNVINKEMYRKKKKNRRESINRSYDKQIFNTPI